MTETTPTVVSPPARLDANNSAQYEKELMTQLDPMPAGVVMDMSDVNYISSAGLRVVLLAAKKVGAAKSKFIICGLSPEVAQVFKISGFLQILKVSPDRAHALAQFG